MVACQIEMDWLDTRYLKLVEVIRYHNRVVNMHEQHRWPVKVSKRDRALEHDGWAQDVQNILGYADQVT